MPMDQEAIVEYAIRKLGSDPRINEYVEAELVRMFEFDITEALTEDQISAVSYARSKVWRDIMLHVTLGY